MIDRIKADIERMKGQERKYLALLHSTRGAIEYAEYVLSVLEAPSKPRMSVDDFARMVAGAGAKVEINDCTRSD